MGIRAVIAVAVLAIGVGQAESATVIYDAKYTLASMSVYCSSGCENYPEQSVNVFAGLRVGQTAKGQITIDDASAPNALLIEFRYGPSLENSLFRQILTLRDSGEYFYDIQEQFFPYPMGSDLTVSWNGESGVFYSWPDTGTIEQRSYVSFAIQPAPIPLPASAALLPIGVGALAMIRKRRRSV